MLCCSEQATVVRGQSWCRDSSLIWIIMINAADYSRMIYPKDLNSAQFGISLLTSSSSSCRSSSPILSVSEGINVLASSAVSQHNEPMN